MTLTEVDNLKKSNPERYYTYILFIKAKMEARQKEAERLKDKAGNGKSGKSDTFILSDDKPEDFVSEIGEMKD
ncbi:MAG TPA: hypothetical protein ENI23_15275 [bacterium]|nr:hypothetical protein [bacterium]